MENPRPEFVAASDGGSGGDAANADGHRVLSKKEPEGEFCSGDDDAGYCDYGPPKEEPEREHSSTDGDSGDGDAGDEYTSRIGVEAYYDPPKEEPEADGDDIDSYFDCDPPKEEPEPGLAPCGDDAVADSGRDVGYECSHCGVNMCTQGFKVEHELRCKARIQRREMESQVTEVYHCSYCRCPFLNKEYREQHQQKWCRKRPVAKKRHSNSSYFKCDKCEYTAKRKQYLERHILKHNEHDPEWFTCTQCSYKTVHKGYMTKHMKNHGNAFSCCCPVCGKSFRTKQRLDDHLVKWHFNESDEVSKLITTKVYICNICDTYRTVVKTAYDRHVTITHQKGDGCEKYECSLCPYSTFRKANLQWHSKTHWEQKEYQCTVCKKQFTQKRALDSHVLSNHADNADLMKTITTKMHRCELCYFKTVHADKLKSHVRSKHI